MPGRAAPAGGHDDTMSGFSSLTVASLFTAFAHVWTSLRMICSTDWIEPCRSRRPRRDGSRRYFWLTGQSTGVPKTQDLWPGRKAGWKGRCVVQDHHTPVLASPSEIAQGTIE